MNLPIHYFQTSALTGENENVGLLSGNGNSDSAVDEDEKCLMFSLDYKCLMFKVRPLQMYHCMKHHKTMTDFLFFTHTPWMGGDGRDKRVTYYNILFLHNID